MGGWRRRERKIWWVNQGDLSVTRAVFMHASAEEPAGRSQSVRKSNEVP